MFILLFIGISILGIAFCLGLSILTNLDIFKEWERTGCFGVSGWSKCDHCIDENCIYAEKR